MITLQLGIPVPIVHTEWSLVFLSFGTSSQRLKTALSLVCNNTDNATASYKAVSVTMMCET